MTGLDGFEFWKAVRGVKVYRRIRGSTSDGRTKWEYGAAVPAKGVPGVLLPCYSNTQQGIRTQVGRVLNGLDPVDCRICIHRRPETPISPEGCAMGGEFGEGFSCSAFEVRV